jgi:hypothetical protein
MSNKLVWNEQDTNKERLRQVYNFVDWLMYEMQDGTVPNMNVPLSIAFVKMAEKGDIDEVTASEHTEMFLYWEEKGAYNVGDLRQYEGTLYKCLQAHTSQADWTPDTSPSLWKVCGISENGVAEWSQPISTSDAYMTDDEVMYEGVHYKSLIDNNVWSPADYPQGWEVIE